MYTNNEEVLEAAIQNLNGFKFPEGVTIECGNVLNKNGEIVCKTRLALKAAAIIKYMEEANKLLPAASKSMLAAMKEYAILHCISGCTPNISLAHVWRDESRTSKDPYTRVQFGSRMGPMRDLYEILYFIKDTMPVPVGLVPEVPVKDLSDFVTAIRKMMKTPEESIVTELI